MPTYEYACDACGHKFEQFQSIKAAPLKMCPKCQRRKVRRLLSAGGGIIFKGTGFYQTDYRSEAYTTAAKAEKEAVSGKSDAGSGTGGSADAGKASTGGAEAQSPPKGDSAVSESKSSKEPKPSGKSPKPRRK